MTLSDEDWIKAEYLRRFGRIIDFNDPVFFTEKLQIYKLEYRKELLTTLSDKSLVREYVSKCIGEEYLIPLIGCYESVDEIPIDDLPHKFIIKATHGSNWNLLCENKSSFDWDLAGSRINGWLNTNYYYLLREWCYKNIHPRIVIESILEDENSAIPADYKIFCFNGEPKLIQVVKDRFEDQTNTFFDLNWKKLPFKYNYPNYAPPIPSPDNLSLILDLAKKLSEGIPFVRVDMYSLRSKIFFGEMTFYPAGGFGVYEPAFWDEIMGDWFDLSSFRPRSPHLGDRLRGLDYFLDQYNILIDQDEKIIRVLKTQLTLNEKALDEINRQLSEIEDSGAWRIILFFRRLRLLVAPHETYREKAWYFLLGILRKIIDG